MLSLQRGRSPGARPALPQEVHQVQMHAQSLMLRLGSSGTKRALELKRHPTIASTMLEVKPLLQHSHCCYLGYILISAELPYHAYIARRFQTVGSDTKCCMVSRHGACSGNACGAGRRSCRSGHAQPHDDAVPATPRQAPTAAALMASAIGPLYCCRGSVTFIGAPLSVIGSALRPDHLSHRKF